MSIPSILLSFGPGCHSMLFSKNMLLYYHHFKMQVVLDFWICSFYYMCIYIMIKYSQKYVFRIAKTTYYKLKWKEHIYHFNTLMLHTLHTNDEIQKVRHMCTSALETHKQLNTHSYTRFDASMILGVPFIWRPCRCCIFWDTAPQLHKEKCRRTHHQETKMSEKYVRQEAFLPYLVYDL
jgi:hypothetical protein